MPPKKLVTLDSAREILKKVNVIGLEVASDRFKVNFSNRNFNTLIKVPYFEATLDECKDTHLLVCVPALSILKICAKVEPRLVPNYIDRWYNKQRFAQNTGEVGCHLIRKTALPGSESKNLNQQRILLPSNEIVPSARVMIYTIIAYHLFTKETIFEDKQVRTADVRDCIPNMTFPDRHVRVGRFNEKGLYIGFYPDDQSHPNLGLASERKPLILNC